MTFITLFFACLGFLSPANRGSLATTAIVLFVFLGCPAGYVSARLYKTFGGERWKCKKAKTIIICVIYIFSECYLDFIFGNGDSILHFLHYEFDIMGRTLIRRYLQAEFSGPIWSIWTHISPIYMILAIPFSTMVVILLLWFGITTPLTFLGAFYGYKKRAIEHPVRTNTIPRTIPEQIFYTKPLPGIVMGGILPFGCIFIQLFFIMNSIWSHQVRIKRVSPPISPSFHPYLNPVFTPFLDLLHVWIYFPGLIDFDRYMFGNNNSTLLFPFGCWRLSMVVAKVKTINIFFKFSSPNFSFLTSGFTSVYFFIYAGHYYRTKLSFEGLASAIIYFGYTFIMAINIFLFTGTVGFFACYWFIRKIYGAVKVD